MSTQNEKGYNQELKFDKGKTRHELVPPQVIEAIADIMTYGANKYSDNSWQNVIPFYDRYYAAMMRHLMAWRKGERLDQESELSHLKHALCCLAFLVTKEEIEYNTPIKGRD
jgi:hypothetical protein